MNSLKKTRISITFSAFFIISALVLVAWLIPDSTSHYAQLIYETFINAHFILKFGVNMILFSLIGLSLSSLGSIRIGGKQAKPEYSWMSWIAMLFSAGMGVGLIVYGPAEPLFHYQFLSDDPQATTQAIVNSIYHWGIHTWAIYALMAIAFAYCFYNRRKKMHITHLAFSRSNKETSSQKPFFLLELITIVAVIAGIAASLGVGSGQISDLINFMSPTEITSASLQYGLIVLLTLCAIVSVFTGIKKGIRVVSNVNITLACVLALFVLSQIVSYDFFKTTLSVISTYCSEFIFMGLEPVNYLGKETYKDWTLFYWGWWISWSTYVGIFIARISYGRTLREMILAIIFIPSIVSLLWFTIFGYAAITQSATSFAAEGFVTNNLVLMNLMEAFPLTYVVAGLTVVVSMLFLITSIDSAVLVLQKLAKGCQKNRLLLLAWPTSIMLFAMSMVVTGTIHTLQVILVGISLAFTIIIMLVIYQLYRHLYYAKNKHYFFNRIFTWKVKKWNTTS